MKKISFLSLFVSIIMMSFAQDTWKVYHNKIEKLITGKPDPVNNVISIKQSDLNAPGFFLLSYSEEKSQTNWIRYLAVYDDADNMLIQKKGESKLKVDNEILKDMFLKNAVIKVFTWTLPADPDLAARIRVRRVHLCTVELK